MATQQLTGQAAELEAGMVVRQPSRQGIINQTLIYLGQDLIADPQAQGVTAQLVASVFDDTLAEALALHPWRFAITARSLAQRAEPPADSRFAHAFALPADCARIVQVEGGHCLANSQPVAAYTIQGDSLLCHADEVQLLYVPTAVPVARMPPAFRHLLALMLACRLAYKITGDSALAKQLLQRLPAVRQEAAHNDGEQTDTLPENRPNLFVAVREY